jgi:hypothetical protein
MRQLYTPSGAAEVAGCSRQAIAKAIKSGKLAAAPVFGAGHCVSSWVITSDVLAAWMRQRRR